MATRMVKPRRAKARATRSMAAGKELGGTEARLAGIIASAMDAIITVDDQQRIQVFNNAAEKMFQRKAAVAIGQHLDILIPPRMREAHRHHVDQFARTNATMRNMRQQHPLCGLRADGTEFPIEASISQVQARGHKLLTAIVRDITERVAAESAVREARQRYQAVFDHAAIGIMLMDRDGMIRDANPASERILGKTKDQLRGKRCTELTHPSDAKQTVDMIASVVSGATESCEYEKRYLRSDGEVVWARVIYSAERRSVTTDGSVRPANDSGRSAAATTPTWPLTGAGPFIIKLIEDITRRKRAEARARRTRLIHDATLHRLGFLTDRERDVLWLMVDGLSTKNIASELGISPKTVDIHRGRVMDKMEADSMAQLVQMVMPIRRLVGAPTRQPRT